MSFEAVAGDGIPVPIDAGPGTECRVNQRETRNGDIRHYIAVRTRNWLGADAPSTGASATCTSKETDDAEAVRAVASTWGGCEYPGPAFGLAGPLAVLPLACPREMAAFVGAKGSPGRAEGGVGGLWAKGRGSLGPPR